MKKILYFSATWCQPCKQFGPVMEQVGKTYPVQKIDINQQPDLVSMYSILNVPTVIILKDNKEVSRFIGIKPFQAVIDMVNSI